MSVRGPYSDRSPTRRDRTHRTVRRRPLSARAHVAILLAIPGRRTRNRAGRQQVVRATWPCSSRVRRVPSEGHLSEGASRCSSLVAMIFLSMSQLAMSCCSEDYAENHELARAHRRRGIGLPSYGADARLSLRSLRRSATRARRLPRLRAVVSSASTGCREPSVPARVPGP